MPRPAREASAPPRCSCCFAALVGLAALFLFPYVFLGRSMLPLELMAIFQPWTRHAGELWGQVPLAHNPLLDTLQQYYPRRVTMTGALHHGWLPLWDPYVYCGSPFLAAQQGAVLYPPAWLLALFAPEVQFGWSALLHLSLAAAGAFLFFRRLDLRPAAAMVGAVAFAFNGFVVVWLAYANVTQWTLCWLPLALYFWERGRAADDLRWMAACAAALALNVLGGHGQSSAYVLMTWGLWAVYRSASSPRPLRAFGRWVALPGALGVALSLGHLLPVLDYVPRTDRAGRVPWPQIAGAGMPLPQLWTFFLPRLFGDGTIYSAQQPPWFPLPQPNQWPFVERSFYPGISVLALAGGAWAVRRESGAVRQMALFSALLTALAVLWAMATPAYWPLWRLLPGFKSFTAVARIISIAAWTLPCLAAAGVHLATSEDAAVRRRAVAGIGAAAAVCGIVALIGHFIYGGNPPASLAPTLDTFLSQEGLPSVQDQANRDFALALLWLAAAAGLLALARPGRGALPPSLLTGLVPFVVAADLFSFGAGYNPRTDPKMAHALTPEIRLLQQQPGPYRFLSIGPPGQGREALLQQRMPSNLPSTFDLPDFLGSDSFVPLRYRKWEEAATRAAGADTWMRAASSNLRSAGVRYYLTGSRQVLPGLTAVGEGAAVQEDPEALPYARLHTHVQPLPDETALQQAMAVPDRFTAVALTAGPNAPAYSGPAATTAFTVRRVNGNRLSIEGTAPHPGLLVVCEEFDPGWRALVDGRPAHPVPADLLLTGVPLEAGSHHVELVYAPAPFRVGLFVTLVSITAAAALGVGCRRAAGALPTR